MELDTGAAVSLISQKTCKETFPKVKLKRFEILLKTYTGEKLPVLGQILVQVKYNGQVHQLPLLVVAGQGPPLLGRNWLSTLRLDWSHIKQVRTGLESLLPKYSEVFRDELGTLKGIETKLVVQEDAKPKFFKPRSVQYAIRGAIEKDLERLENLGVIEKIKYSDWAAPIVPVPKSDGTIRICGDYKVTINPVLQVDQHPLPRVEDLFATLAGGKTFSKLDLSHAYQQVLVEPTSWKYLTKGVPWKWTEECRSAFQELKKRLSSSEVLVHYDPDLPLKLDCDASAYGVGAVLSHVFPNGDERPVAYASKTLTQSERGYAQLEKEALSLVYGVKKFHLFLYGRRFTLITDHKPLVTILGPKKGIPTLAAARLQRWALVLAAYQYDIEFRSTKEHCNADGFSRLPLASGEQSICCLCIQSESD